MKEHFQKVFEVFETASPFYDRMNDILSLKQHFRWKRYFVQQLPFQKIPEDFHCVDMSCGTGDIPYLILQENPDFFDKNKGHLVCCDPNPLMLSQAKEKLQLYEGEKQIHFHTAYAEEPCLQENFFDLYTISFGLRNTSQRQIALQKAYALLKKGGFFYCLEFSKPHHPLIEKAFYVYLKTMLPLCAAIFTDHMQPYEYLAESILSFPGARQLQIEIAKAGFQDTGFYLIDEGIVALHYGHK